MDKKNVFLTVEEAREIFGEEISKESLTAMKDHYTSLVQNAWARDYIGYYSLLNSILENHNLPLIPKEEQKGPNTKVKLLGKVDQEDSNSKVKISKRDEKHVKN